MSDAGFNSDLDRVDVTSTHRLDRGQQRIRAFAEEVTRAYATLTSAISDGKVHSANRPG